MNYDQIQVDLDRTFDEKVKQYKEYIEKRYLNTLFYYEDETPPSKIIKIDFSYGGDLKAQFYLENGDFFGIAQCL